MLMELRKKILSTSQFADGVTRTRVQVRLSSGVTGPEAARRAARAVNTFTDRE